MRKRSWSQSGSAIRLIAIMIPSERAIFERLEIAAERDPLAMFAQALFVDRLEADEHVFEPELSPEAKYLLVAQQHIAAGLEVVFLADAGADDRLADLHAVPLLHEGDIVDDEDTRLADRAKILDDALRADHPVAAAVKGPGAAEGAVPRAASRELDRGARIERAEKIFAGGGAAGRAPASGHRANGQTPGGGPSPAAVTAPGTAATSRPASIGGEEQRHRRLALALEHAIDRPRPVLDDGGRR